MRILGIDPGLATIGIGIVDAESAQNITTVDWFTITTPAGNPAAQRLSEIAADLTAVVQEHRPELAVVEKLYFAVNEQTAIDVAQARGVILQTLAAASVPVLEPTPLQLKAAITGDGHADKLQIQTMLKQMLQLDEIPSPDDAADALALAVYGTLDLSLADLPHLRAS